MDEKYRKTYFSSAREIYEKGYAKVTSSRTRKRLVTDTITIQKLVSHTLERTKLTASLQKFLFRHYSHVCKYT